LELSGQLLAPLVLPPEMELGGPRIRSGRFGEKNNLLLLLLMLLLGIE
jgi:hypothetical protein